MDFEIFVNEMADEMREVYPDAEITVHNVPKNGEVLTGIIIMVNDNESSQAIAPTIYLNDYYEDYLDGRDLSEIVETVADVAKDALENMPQYNLPNLSDWESVKDSILAQIVGNENNEQFLDSRVSTRDESLEDLSYVYRINLDEGSIPITNGMLLKWNIDKNTLHETALANSFEKEMPVICDIREIMAELMGVDVADIDVLMGDGEEPKVEQIVVTNESKMFGAVNIFNEEVQDDLADRIGGDFYILPSSVHEVIVIPADPERLGEFKDTVREVNEEQVDPKDRLSDHVFAFDAENRQLCKAEELHAGRKHKLQFSLESMEEDLKRKRGEEGPDLGAVRQKIR